MSPREGMVNSRRTRPEPWFTRFFMRPLRMDSFSVTTPVNDSSQSMNRCSTGSLRTPFSIR